MRAIIIKKQDLELALNNFFSNLENQVEINLDYFISENMLDTYNSNIVLAESKEEYSIKYKIKSPNIDEYWASKSINIYAVNFKKKEIMGYISLDFISNILNQGKKSETNAVISDIEEAPF